MNIVYLTDIHDNLRGLRFVVQNLRPDLFILSGDLIYKAFFTENKLYKFVELQESLYDYIRRTNLTINAYELATAILDSNGKYSLKLQLDAAEYHTMFKQASLNMKAKYRIIHDLIKKYAVGDVIFIPGNYDMDLQYTHLAQYDLHKQTKTISGIKFSGYGGAPVMTSGIPEMISVAFNEYYDKGKLISEPKDYFLSNQAEILVIHNPAYGTLDKLPSYGHCGSTGIREYIDSHAPRLVLSGHVHEDYGLIRKNDTFCLNPSNFGGVDAIHGWQAGGYFSTITLEREDVTYLRKVTLNRIVQNELVDIAEVRIDKNLRCGETVLNDEEFNKLGHFLK